MQQTASAHYLPPKGFTHDLQLTVTSICRQCEAISHKQQRQERWEFVTSDLRIDLSVMLGRAFLSNAGRATSLFWGKLLRVMGVAFDADPHSWGDELNELAERLTRSCHAVDPQSTDQFLDDSPKHDPLGDVWRAARG